MEIRFSKGLLLRSPSLPDRQDLSRANLKKLWDDQFVRESIYLASKSLYQKIEDLFEEALPDLDKQDRLLQTLYKYISRMSNRPTPFGLFAGCSFLRWSHEERLKLSTHYKKYITLDGAVQFELFKQLETIEGDNASYVINNTLHRFFKEYRFIRYQTLNGERLYEMSQMAYHQVLEELLRALGRGSKTKAQLKKLLSGYDDEGVALFIRDLIDAQFLNHTSKPNLLECKTQKEIDRHVTIFNPAEIYFSKGLRNDAKLDWQKNYEDWERNIDTATKSAFGNYFHVTLINELESNSISLKWQKKLTKGIKLLNNLMRPAPNKRLSQFTQRFKNRYDTARVPIFEVFDIFSGLDYEDSAQTVNFLIDGLSILNQQTASVPQSYNETDIKLRDVLSEAQINRNYKFAISHDFVSERPLDGLPYSMSVFFQTFENDRLYLDKVTGPCALNMIGRFTGYDDQILDLAKDIVQMETQGRPEVLFAEINHLPDDRALNVMAHPPLWSAELCYVDVGGKADAVYLEDLTVALEKDSFVIYSERHQKEIVPRLSSAFNYHRSQHPIYTFLCDIQHQGRNGWLKFDWGALSENFIHYPRVETTDGIILHKATWRFPDSAFSWVANMNTGVDEQLINCIKLWKHSWFLPDKFFIVEGDNNLFIDMGEQLGLQILVKEIAKKRSCLIITEILHAQYTSTVRDREGNTYAHEMVAPVYLHGSIVQRSDFLGEINERRDFLPGSEWLYVKLYLNISTSNEVLRLLDSLLKSDLLKELCSQWFFVRYIDPNYHLRIRVRLFDEKEFLRVYQYIYTNLADFLSNKQISAIQLDTYKREVERYKNQIMWAESVFDVDSRFCMNILNMHVEEEEYCAAASWEFLGMIANYLSFAGGSRTDQIRFARQQLEAFKLEFPNKAVKIRIDHLYQKHKIAIGEAFRGTSSLLIAHKRELLEVTRKHHGVWDEQSLKSIIHMSVNRYFREQQRLNEFIFYGIIVKYLTALNARNASQEKSI